MHNNTKRCQQRSLKNEILCIIDVIWKLWSFIFGKVVGNNALNGHPWKAPTLCLTIVWTWVTINICLKDVAFIESLILRQAKNAWDISKHGLHYNLYSSQGQKTYLMLRRYCWLLWAAKECWLWAAKEFFIQAAKDCLGLGGKRVSLILDGK